MVISSSEVAAKVRALLGNSYKIKKGGSGAAGMRLEQLLGVKPNSADSSDIGGWEIKYHSGGASLLTLFHKTPSPKGVVKELIDAHGWIGSDGRECFRHTLSGGEPTERGFFVVNSGEMLEVRNKTSDIVARWTHDDIINGAAKVRKLIVVTGKTRKVDGVPMAFYQTALAFTGFKVTQFIPAAAKGIVKVDFDARYKYHNQDPTAAIRDHGTKFRIYPRELPQIYNNIEQI